MWTALLSFIGGPIVNGLIAGYKAKLEAGNTSERIAADLAQRELALQEREREFATQLAIKDEGRWWTAAPRAIVMWSFAIAVATWIVWDNILGLGTHDFPRGPVGDWMGWLMATWFGGRSLEKVARILRK